VALSAVLAAGEEASTGKAALFGMIATLGTAIIYGVFSLLQSRFGKKPEPEQDRPARRGKTQREHDAMERFLLLHGYDPRKIKTGYEPAEQVRHDRT
jgi:hypothetical protein